MNTEISSMNEKIFAFFCCLPGFIVACVVAPKDEAILFTVPVLWLPQLVVYAFLIMLTTPYSIISGTLIVNASFLALFGWWVISRLEPIALLGYPFTLPGAAIGAFAAKFISAKFLINRPLINGCLGASCSLIGLLINLFLFLRSLKFN